jgi:type IV pilus assembly protein PilN
MIKINLLHRSVEEKEKKANVVRQIAIVVLSLVTFLAILASVQLYFVHTIGNLETDIATREARLLVLKKIIGEIDDIREEKRVLEKKLAVINRLEEDRLYPVRMLDEVNTMVTPKDIQLTKVSEQGSRLNIDGVGRDNIAVAIFMKSLELSKYIQSVDLISSKQVDMSGVKVNQFSLSCVKKRS